MGSVKRNQFPIKNLLIDRTSSSLRRPVTWKRVMRYFLQFNLICGSAWKRPFLTSTLMVGFLCGSIIGGYVSDR